MEKTNPKELKNLKNQKNQKDQKNQKEQKEQKDLYHVIYLPRGTERLEKLGILKHYPKNYQLNIQDTVPSYCYIVKKGMVIGTECSALGEQRIYNLMEEGSLFLEECLLFDRTCPVAFRTLTACDLVCIDKCDLKRAFKHDIDVVMDVCESLTTKFLSCMDQLRLGPRQNTSWKICRLLTVLAERHGEKREKGVLVTEKISQQMIADLLGLNRVTVTRKLLELIDLGLLAKEGSLYLIPDMEKLEGYMKDIEQNN